MEQLQARLKAIHAEETNRTSKANDVTVRKGDLSKKRSAKGKSGKKSKKVNKKKVKELVKDIESAFSRFGTFLVLPTCFSLSNNTVPLSSRCSCA